MYFDEPDPVSGGSPLQRLNARVSRSLRKSPLTRFIYSNEASILPTSEVPPTHHVSHVDGNLYAYPPSEIDYRLKPLHWRLFDNVVGLPSLLSSLCERALESTWSPSPAVIFSYLMTAFSLFILLHSLYNVRDYTHLSTFRCDSSLCVVTPPSFGNLPPPVSVSFPRSNFERCALIRIDAKGNVVDPVGIKRNESRKLGYSYAVSFREERMIEGADAGTGTPGSATTGIRTETIARVNLGKKAARDRATALNQQVRSPKIKDVEFKEGAAFHVGSIITAFVGLMMFTFMTLIGEFRTTNDGGREREGKKRR